MADVIVIGAGAAGLSVAVELERRDVDVLVLERASRPGDSWRRRYRRLHLHTDRRLSHVARHRLPRRLPTFVPAADFASYLETVAASLRHGVRTGSAVVRGGVRATSDGVEVHLDEGEVLDAQAVVVCTGQNDVPLMPVPADGPESGCRRLHSSEYDTGSAFAGSRAIVIGSGNSGSEIALDLVEHGAAEVSICIRSVPTIAPRSLGPTSAHLVGMLVSSMLGSGVQRRLGRTLALPRAGRLRAAGLFPPTAAPDDLPLIDHGFVDAVLQGRIQIHGGAAALTEQGVRLASGNELAADVVVCATGFTPAASALVDASLADRMHAPLHEQPLADARIWFCGFGPAPQGQLIAARRQAKRIARDVAGTLRSLAR